MQYWAYINIDSFTLMVLCVVMAGRNCPATTNIKQTSPLKTGVSYAQSNSGRSARKLAGKSCKQTICLTREIGAFRMFRRSARQHIVGLQWAG